MALVWYVKNGGTASSSAGTVDLNGGTLRTGSWDASAANYFDSIEACITNTTPALAGDDYILCSSSHLKDYGADKELTLPNGCTVIGVDDSNQDQILSGAIERNGTAAAPRDCSLKDGVVKSLRWESSRSITAINSEGQATFQDCELYMHSGGAAFGGGNDGASFRIINSDIHFNNGCEFTCFAGSRIELFNVVQQDTDTHSGPFFDSNGAGGGKFHVDGFDVSKATSLTNLLTSMNPSDDTMDFELNNVLLPSGAAIYDTAAATNKSIKIKGSSIGSADEYYGTFVWDYRGLVTDDLAVFRTGTYDGTDEISMLIETTADCTIWNPFRYKIATIPFQDLSGAGGKTYTVHILSPTSGLRATDVYIELTSQDNTSQAMIDVDTTREADITLVDIGTTLGCTSSTALTSGSGWTGSGTAYQISKNIAQKANVSNTNVEVYVCVARPSTDVNVDVAVVVS